MAETEPKRGRPDLQGSIELDAHLMATAARLFIENGYEGTSMGQIVTAAGAGKQSLYRRYANKEVLFKDVFTKFLMKNVMDRCRQELAMFDTEYDLEVSNSLEALHRIALKSFGFMIERETVETFRLFVAERNRFPDLKSEIIQMVEEREAQITQHIRRAQMAGFIRTDIDQHTSRSFMALINEGPMIHALLDLPSLSTAEDQKLYFDSAWRAFIDSVAVRP